MTTVRLKQYKKYNLLILEDKINPDRNSSVAHTCFNYNQYLNQSSPTFLAKGHSRYCWMGCGPYVENSQ
jgi:hypothetical protein